MYTLLNQDHRNLSWGSMGVPSTILSLTLESNAQLAPSRSSTAPGSSLGAKWIIHASWPVGNCSSANIWWISGQSLKLVNQWFIVGLSLKWASAWWLLNMIVTSKSHWMSQMSRNCAASQAHPTGIDPLSFSGHMILFGSKFWKGCTIPPFSDPIFHKVRPLTSTDHPLHDGSFCSPFCCFTFHTNPSFQINKPSWAAKSKRFKTKRWEILESCWWLVRGDT